MSRRMGAIAALVVVAAVATGTLVLRGGDSGADRPEITTSVAPIERRSLSVHENVAGVLGYGREATVAAPASGVVTGLPETGTVIKRGRSLLELDGQPARVLLYGTRPAWRDLKEGVDDGDDVRQLERNLVALGLDPGNAIRVDRHFDVATRAAVDRLQGRLGMTRSGWLAAGAVQFSPGPVRVAKSTVVVGRRVEAGAEVLTTTAANQLAIVRLKTSLRRFVALGDRVPVLLPDGRSVTGRLSAISSVAEVDEQRVATVELQVTLDRTSGGSAFDQVPVSVEITKTTVANAFVVPVTALITRPGPSYAVELVSATGERRLVSVTPGLYADGFVAIEGDGLRAGANVTVPA